MNKVKTHKGTKKRFKITGSGKVMIQHQGKGHILTKKSSKRKRRLRKDVVLSKELAGNVKKLLPNG